MIALRLVEKDQNEAVRPLRKGAVNRQRRDLRESRSVFLYDGKPQGCPFFPLGASVPARKISSTVSRAILPSR